LAKHFQGKEILADELFQTIDPFAKPYLKDLKRWSFTNELWLTYERSKLIKKELRRRIPKLSIIDSGLLMSWVYSYGHSVSGSMTEDEWELYQKLYDSLSVTILKCVSVVMLDYPIETWIARMKKRGRASELKYYTPEYLRQIQRGLEALKHKLWRHSVPVTIITEKDCPDFEANEKDCEFLIQKVTEALGEGK